MKKKTPIHLVQFNQLASYSLFNFLSTMFVGAATAFWTAYFTVNPDEVAIQVLFWVALTLSIFGGLFLLLAIGLWAAAHFGTVEISLAEAGEGDIFVAVKRQLQGQTTFDKS